MRARIPKVLLVIAGEGPSIGHVKRLTRALGLEANVLFVGYLDRRKALLDCYRAADAFVFASGTETQGLVLLKAPAVGLPVVSTAVMGSHDNLAPQRGALVVPDDKAAFADATVRVLQDRALRTRLSNEAPAYAPEAQPEVAL